MSTVRDTFSASVSHLLDDNERLAFLTADIGTDRIEQAMQRHPARCMKLGIREALTVGVASGMALDGFRPIAHSYAPFILERAFGQLKIDVSHQGVGIIIASLARKVHRRVHEPCRGTANPCGSFVL